MSTMMQVTDNAKRKLKNILHNDAKNRDMVVRIISSLSNNKSFELILDTLQEGDEVVSDTCGVPVLAIGENMSDKLNGYVFDFRAYHNGKGFSIHRINNRN